MFSPQLYLVRTCVLIWSLPTRPSTRAPLWEPSPPPPSLSMWTTKQRSGTVSTCFPFFLFLVAFNILWQTRLLYTLQPKRQDGRHVKLPGRTHSHAHTLPYYCHLYSSSTWSYWCLASWSRWLNWLSNMHPLNKHIQTLPTQHTDSTVKGWVVWSWVPLVSLIYKPGKTKYPESFGQESLCWLDFISLTNNSYGVISRMF